MASTAERVGVFASTPPSTAKRERSRAGRASPHSSTTSDIDGRRPVESATGSPGAGTGTKAGSNATGKLEEARAARASWAAVPPMLRTPNGSPASSASAGRFQRNRAACTVCGRRWPSASTVTSWLPPRTVVAIVRSIGATEGGTGSSGSARRAMAAFSCGRKWSSPLSSELGAPRNGCRSRASMRPCSTHTSRSEARSAKRLTWASARAAPLTPPAEVPETTSTRAVQPVRRNRSAYGLFPPAALTRRSSSRATPPIQTASETPPFMTTPKRISSAGTPDRSCSLRPCGPGCSPMAHSCRRG